MIHPEFPKSPFNTVGWRKKAIEESDLGNSIPLDKSNDYDVALATSYVTDPNGKSLIDMNMKFL